MFDMGSTKWEYSLGVGGEEEEKGGWGGGGKRNTKLAQLDGTCDMLLLK